MTQPNWQVFLARELAARAGNTDHDFSAAAYIVRGLAVRHPQLASIPAGETDTQAKFSGYANDTESPLFPVMRKLWADLDVPAAVGTGGKSASQTAAALWQRAMVDFLWLSSSDSAAAEEIATEAKKLPWFGATVTKTASGETEERLEWGEGEAWGALSGVLGGFGAGFGSLRTELEASATPANRDTVLADYDKLVSNATLRRTYVRQWQEWAKGQSRYMGEIDGLWGRKSESAWLTYAPASYAKPTTLDDLRVMAYPGNAAVLFAAAISRDKWVAANPAQLPPPPSTPSTTASTSTPESSELVEEDVVVTPEEEAPAADGTVDDNGWTDTDTDTDTDGATDTATLLRNLPNLRLPNRVPGRIAVIPREEPSTSRGWLPWVLGIGSVAVIGGVVWVLGGSKKPPYEEGG